MGYTDFQWAGGITNFQTWSLQVRSSRTVANFYIRITGIAQFPGDPRWDDRGMDEYAWHSGTLLITTPPIFEMESGDRLVEYCATAGFRELDRDENPNVASTDDFGMALDEVPSVVISGPQMLTMTINAAYKGDAWAPDISFTVDFLVYRPDFDGKDVEPPPPNTKFEHRIGALIADAVRLADFLKQG